MMNDERNILPDLYPKYESGSGYASQVAVSDIKTA
jgi:hypothetical protein